MNEHDSHFSAINRRTFLGRTGLGLGSVALANLESARLAQAGSGILPATILPAKAKRVIFLYMSGGPSHLETFDYKPALLKHDGEPMPESFTQGQPIAQLQGKELKCLRPQFEFHKHGESGQEIADILPFHAEIADDIAIIRSMHTDQINHDPAHTVMNTGSSISGRPSMGAWITYGLGAESSDLPGFVVMTSEGGRNPQPISTRMWSAGFLPAQHQGVMFYSKGDPVHYIANPPGVSVNNQQRVVETINQLNRHRQQSVPDRELTARISQYELAFRMQRSIPELMDLRDEPQHALDLYGVNSFDGSFAANCLMARRMVERGVRFIQLYHRDWDHHGDLVHYMKICTGCCDRPTAALIKDLKQRGLLDETLIVWGGEFGRTPMFQGKGKEPGRDHHIQGFSMWLAGGGVKGGLAYGATDDFGHHAVTNIVNHFDYHATLLHLFGLEPEKLVFQRPGGVGSLLDGQAGKIVWDILKRGPETAAS